MARLFVGQRVRILWSESWPELAGQEGRIIGRADPGLATDPRCEWRVAPDAWGTDFAPGSPAYGPNSFWPNSSQLEPILPDGHQACDDDFKRDLDRLLDRQGIAA